MFFLSDLLGAVGKYADISTLAIRLAVLSSSLTGTPADGCSNVVGATLIVGADMDEATDPDPDPDPDAFAVA